MPYSALFTGVVLGYNITHTTEFDYDRIDLRFVSTETLTKMVSLSLHMIATLSVCFFVSGYY